MVKMVKIRSSKSDTLLSDLCTGAAQYTYEHDINNQAANELIRSLVKINTGIKLNYSSPYLPKVDQFKIHHCLCKF